MGRRILFTFAGRKDRMSLLRQHVLSLLDKNIIDEWHIWDFTRTREDRSYVQKTYNPVKYMYPGSGYQHLASLAQGEKKEFLFSTKSDLHVALKDKKSSLFYEYIFSGSHDEISLVQSVSDDRFHSDIREEYERVYTKHTPQILLSPEKQLLKVSFSTKGFVDVAIPTFSFPKIDLGHDTNSLDVYVRGGAQHSLDIFHQEERILRFVGKIGEQYPYWRAYKYYHDRYDMYKNDTFLKCDDDIIFIDEEKMSSFIDEIERNKEYTIFFANVVNNGVAAYLQQKNSSIPQNVGNFERPLGGFGGSLWESGEKAHNLHKFFVKNGKKILPLEKKLVEWGERYSINFIGWRGDDIKYMSMPDMKDDEYFLTVQLPSVLHKKNVVFSDFMVSHLSFSPQESNIQSKEIISLYER